MDREDRLGEEPRDADHLAAGGQRLEPVTDRVGEDQLLDRAPRELVPGALGEDPVGDAGVDVLRPALLAPFNRVWTKLALVLSKIMNPVIMAILFFLVVAPIGLLMRLTGKRPLALAFDPAAKSYWIERTPPAPLPGSMKNQF